MVAQLVTFVILLILALVIIVAGVLIMDRFGKKERAVSASFQALRWLMVGAIIATIGDAFASGSATDILLPFALAFVVLSGCKYFVQVQEEKSEYI